MSGLTDLPCLWYMYFRQMLLEAFEEFWVRPKLESTKGGWDMTLDEIWDMEDLSTTGGRLINVYEVSKVVYTRQI